MARALILAPFSHDHLDRLRGVADVCYESWLDTRHIYDPEELAARIRDEGFDLLVIESDFAFEELFQGAPQLRFVGVCRNATNHVDVEAATRYGVAVVNTPGRNAQAVAEHALGLMLALARRIPAADRYVRDSLWQNPAEPYISMRGLELSERTLGIVGLGAVGGRLAEIGIALGMRVVGFDPYVEHTPRGVTLADLDYVMAESDFVSVHVPAAPETEGLLNGGRLSLMKQTAYLVSASDASVVDQEALVQALRGRRIGGAALDVFDSHPVSPQSPLLELDNVVLSPHLGGATAETVERHSQMMTDDILLFLDGRPPERIVNPAVWKQSG